jgi:putative CocE/NonD family hydrolase
MKSLFRAALCALALLVISQAARAQAAPASPQQFQMAPEKLADYVGQFQYDDDPDVIPCLSVESGRLFVESYRSARQELAAQAEDVFSFSNPRGRMSFKFIRSAAGKVTGYDRTAPDGSTRHAKKINDRPLHFDKPDYIRQEAMIPMRDGVKLHAVILRPKDYSAPLPFLMERTPYGVDGNTPESIYPGNPELAASRYIFVFQDIRGRFKSEGQFVMSRAMVAHGDPKLVDESTDTYDTVAWLLANIPNHNGRVGVYGISYPGFLAIAAGIDPHPAVKAISPQAPMIDVWMGDDFFHNGAFRQTYGYDYAYGMETSKENGSPQPKEDTYDFFLSSGTFEAAAKRDGVDKLPTGIAFLQHPAYDQTWRSRGVQWHLNKVNVPTLFVGGFWDQEDMFGPQEAYAKAELHDARQENFLVLGPWNHGQWANTSRLLGPIQFGQPTTDEFRKRYQAPFFAHYLKDEKGFDLKDSAAFETGSNRWREYTHWPPTESKTQNLYLAADGSLNFSSTERNKAADQASALAKFREYVSDPANPVPYRHRPVQVTYSQGSKWSTWMVEDQRFVSDRPDVVTWTTPPLDHDVTVTGDVIADLFASTSGTDSDWVVKLLDEYPASAGSAAPGDPVASQPELAGYQLIINAEIFRGRYRNSFERPEAIASDKVLEYRFSLHAADHTFLKGHRIKVQVQSTWFPLYDRNPQKFVPNIMTAAPGDYAKATQRIYPTSHLILPVAP